MQPGIGCGGRFKWIDGTRMPSKGGSDKVDQEDWTSMKDLRYKKRFKITK